MAMKKLKLGLVIAVLSGGALACTVNALPPLEVEVGLFDIAGKWMDNYDRPGTAAFLDNLDEMGRQIYGADWRVNEFRGYVVLRSGLGDLGLPDGRHIQYVEKPCNTDALDTEEQGGGGSEANAGDGAVFTDTWSYISDWYFNYYEPTYYGGVGDITVIR